MTTDEITRAARRRFALGQMDADMKRRQKALRDCALALQLVMLDGPEYADAWDTLESQVKDSRRRSAQAIADYDAANNATR